MSGYVLILRQLKCADFDKCAFCLAFDARYYLCLKSFFGAGAGKLGDGVPAFWMGGCCPLISSLPRLGLWSWHWGVAVRRRDEAPSSLPNTCVLSNFLILADIVAWHQM